MTKKTLSLKVKTKRVAKAVKDVPQDNPEEHFSNGIAINPTELVRLELGSKQLTARAMYLIPPIELGQRGSIVAPPGCKKTHCLYGLI